MRLQTRPEARQSTSVPNPSTHVTSVSLSQLVEGSESAQVNWPQAETLPCVRQSESKAPQACVSEVAGEQETRLFPTHTGSLRLVPPSKRPAQRSESTKHALAAAQPGAEARQPVSAQERALVRTARGPGRSGIVLCA